MPKFATKLDLPLVNVDAIIHTYNDSDVRQDDNANKNVRDAIRLGLFINDHTTPQFIQTLLYVLQKKRKSEIDEDLKKQIDKLL